MEKYLSVGKSTLNSNLFMNIKNNGIKPLGGLWATKQDTQKRNSNAWIEHIFENPTILLFKYNNNLDSILLTLEDNANIFILKTQKDLEFLKINFPSENDLIDYESISKCYDGLFINIHQLDVTAMMKFSVNSLILFNLDCINYYQKCKISIESNDFEEYYGEYREFTDYIISVDEEKQQVTNNPSLKRTLN